MLSLRQGRILEDRYVGIRWWIGAGWWETLILRLLKWVVAWVGAELDGTKSAYVYHRPFRNLRLLARSYRSRTHQCPNQFSGCRILGTPRSSNPVCWDRANLKRT